MLVRLSPKPMSVVPPEARLRTVRYSSPPQEARAAASASAITRPATRILIRITAADNGRGFPFHGHCDHAALIARKLGPVMLKERVGSLGRSLAIHSAPTGARLEIRLLLVQSGG